MPTRPPIHGQVDQHRRQDARASACERGYDARWRKARLAFLRAHPLCVECVKAGQVEASSVVDHVVPHRGNDALFWDQSNWAALCARCHNRKTGSGH